VALDLKDENLELAKQIGADDILKISSAGSKSNPTRIKEDISRITNGKGVDVVVDCVGAENTIYDPLRILKKGGALVVVGLFGDEIKVPLLPIKRINLISIGLQKYRDITGSVVIVT
jgi:propanol-preferring alcohol dehydrogenase